MLVWFVGNYFAITQPQRFLTNKYYCSCTPCDFTVLLELAAALHLVVIVTPSLPRDGGIAEDHGAPEPGQLSRVWTRGRREIKSRQRASGAKGP